MPGKATTRRNTRVEEFGPDEAALRKLGANFRTVADFSYDMEYWIDADGRLLYVSPSCERITGYAAEEVVREPALLVTMVHPDDRAALAAHLTSEMRKPETDSREYRIVTKDGQVRWIGHRCQPVIDRNGRFRGRRASNRDITKRKQMEETLAAGERRYRELVETVNSIILRWDRDGTIHFINDRGAALLGYEPNELIGRHVMTIVPDVETTGRSLSSLTQDILNHPENYVFNSNENVRKDGTRIYIAWTNKAITDENGTVREILAVGNDTTVVKRTEAEVDRVAQQRQLALKAAQMGWWHYDPITRMARLDDGFRKIFDLKEAELPVDEILTRTIHPDDVSDLWAKVEAALDPVDPQPFMAEYRIQRPDGAIRWIEAHGMASFDGTGPDRRAISLVGTVLDISERKEAADALRDSERLLRMAQEAGRVGSFDWDLVSREARCSREYFQVMGRSIRPDGLVLFDEWQSWIHPEDRDNLLAHLQAALEGKAEVSGEYRMVGEDGEVRWIFYRGQIARDAEGHPVGMLGTAQDITRHKQAEDALRESEERLRLATESAEMGMWTVDIPSQRWEFSAQAARLFGLPGEEPIGADQVRALTHPDDRARLIAESDHALCSEGLHELEYRIIRPDGAVRWIVLRGRTEIDGEGRLRRNMGVVMDITDRKQAEEALRWSARRHEVLSRAGARLLRSDDPRELVDDLCREIMDLLECQVFFNFLVDERTQRLHLNAYAGVPESEAHQVEWLDINTVIRGGGACDGAEIVAEDLRCVTDPRAERFRSLGIEAFCCVPLKIQDRLIGTLSFGTRRRPRFEPKQLEVIEAVADLVAMAMYRVQTEATLRQDEQRLRTVLDGGRMGRWEWDVRDETSVWSDRVYEFLGLPRSTAPKNTRFFDHVYEPDRETLRTSIAEAVAAGGSCEAEFRIRRGSDPHPEFVWLALRGQVICDEAGRATRMISVLFDITRSKQMEFQLRRMNERLAEEVQAQTEELQDSVERLRDEVDQRVQVENRLRRSARLLEAFFEHTITPLVFLDRDFNFVRVNGAYAQAGGKTREYYVGKNHFALYPSQENESIFRRVVRTKQPYRAFAKAFTYPDDPDGRVTYWNWQVTPLLDERGEVENLVLSLEDVTERQEAVQELERRARQLQQLTLELSQAEDRERKRLAQILHDDLQQQLAGTKFHMNLLTRRVEYDAEAYGMATQLDGMIKDSIEKARSLSHELSPAVLYESDLAKVFRWLANDMRAKHGLVVHVIGEGITINSDPLKPLLYKAGRELLFNVVKHAKAREVRLRLRRLGPHVCLAVCDQGRGFEPESLGEAVGFGLLSIRERVRLLGGRMRIRSTPGVGSRFTIAVPDGPRPGGIPDAKSARRQTDLGVLRQGTQLPGASRRLLRVVVADDHHLVRQGLAALLAEEPDMELVGQAVNGREAIDIVRRLRPDVVIIDVSMPSVNGSEATRRIKALAPETRVIALSMFTEGDMAQEMREAGAETYLLKTDPPERLLAAIRDRGNVDKVVPDGPQ